MPGNQHESQQAEFIVVGSGAGGGTVAARLAETGRTVILLEAGGDPRQLSGGDPVQPDGNRLPDDYDVPAFHAFASENDAMKWDFLVNHYPNGGEPSQPPFHPQPDGVLYPRAGTLGGCTAHNAMILVYPCNSDWDYIAELTGDQTWRADRMRDHFERLENCRHRPLYRWLAKLGINPTRHGWDGWLPTEVAHPMAVLDDNALVRTIIDEAFDAFLEDGHQARRVRWFLQSGLDPNDWRLVDDNSSGIRYLPLTTRYHARSGTRERVLDVAHRYPDRLKIVLNALAARVLLDDNNRAIGVEYLQGERLYRACANPSSASGELNRAYASREVILSGGAFNSPQLLMLSGIGPASELARYGIRSRADLPKVGKNLQDRYEISVVNRMKFKRWKAYRGSTFSPGDPQHSDWKSGRTGIYSTNGSVVSIFRPSPVAEGIPDLFCMSLLASFSGYYPHYSEDIARHFNYLTWVVLKAHTQNRSGEVALRSADPRDPPLINFNYFAECGDHDLDAVVDGIRFVRRLSQVMKDRGMIEEEELPGFAISTTEALREYVRANAWGHHASCTCPIGRHPQDSVVDSQFRVHGVQGLRIVDASVFPRIPGFFIAAPIYIVAEKAAESILAAHAR